MIIRALAIMFFIILLTGCNSRDDVSLKDLLKALEDAGIQYAERAETQNIYDMRRGDAERHLYQLQSGKLTIYRFPSVDQRREVQRDPFPTATAVPPNGSYGMGRMLVFYYDGDDVITQKLIEAFEPFKFEDSSQLQ